MYKYLCNNVQLNTFTYLCNFVSLKYDLDSSGLIECRVDIEDFTLEIQFL